MDIPDLESKTVSEVFGNIYHQMFANFSTKSAVVQAALHH